MDTAPEDAFMTRRAIEIAGFLNQHGWDDTMPTPVAADLSPRRYARLEKDDGRRAILMDADPDQKTSQFVALAKILRDCGISGPEIFAADIPNGLVLMQDFGDRNFGRMIDSGHESAPLYRRAVDVLVQLHKGFDKSMTQATDLPIFNATLFTTQAELFLDAYFLYTKDREATAEERESFRTAWLGVLKGVEKLPQSLLLRDFMPDNLMDLPNGKGLAATGVLDFQDAGYGPIAYDIASLCEVARRDGGDILLNEMIAYYHEQAKPSVSIAELKTACRILTAQRHTRILGIIVQHAQRTGRQEKLNWLPRIEKYLNVLLQDAALQPVHAWMVQNCPMRVE